MGPTSEANWSTGEKSFTFGAAGRAGAAGPAGASGQSPSAAQNSPIPNLQRALDNAESNLGYAAGAGISIDPEAAERIIAAKRGGDEVWHSPEAGVLLADISKLEHHVWSVTTRPLKKQIKKYTLIAIGLALVIVPLSMFSFVTSGISGQITDDLTSANELVLKLHTELDSVPLTGQAKNAPAPFSSLSDLQQFAIEMRMAKDRTGQLDQIALLNQVPNRLTAIKWQKFELSPNLANFAGPLHDETNSKTRLYQYVRLTATEIQDQVTLYYGAVSTCLLPMLYALLGACAFLLRRFSDELNTRAFSPSYSISARFFVALIGGMIVGLFSTLILGPGAKIPPLGIAFLVGYASDLFFSFLEGLLQIFKTAKPN
jgi:hypothetical protein